MTTACNNPCCKKHLHDMLRFFCTQTLSLLDELEKVQEEPKIQVPKGDSLTEEEIDLLAVAEEAEREALQAQEEPSPSPRRKRRPSKVEQGLSQTPTKRSSPERELEGELEGEEDSEVEELLASMDDMVIHPDLE